MNEKQAEIVIDFASNSTNQYLEDVVRAELTQLLHRLVGEVTQLKVVDA